MPDVPKIVLERLRAGTPAGGHPDPNVLTAFAEQALSAVERESVLEHIAQCGDCREVIALALPASEIVPAQSTLQIEEVGATRIRGDKTEKTWFTWPGLRWAAVAAGVLAVASVLMLRPGKPPQPTVASVPSDKQSAPRSVSADATKPATPPAEQAQALTSSIKADESFMSRNADHARGRVVLRSPSGTREIRGRAEVAKLESGPELKDSRQRDLDAFEVRADKPSAAAPPATAGSTPVGAAAETVEVTAAAPAVETNERVSGNLVARSMEPLPIEKAKAPVETQAEKATTAQRTKKQALGASSNYAVVGALAGPLQAVPAANWRLSAEGTLERSLSAGSNWQTVLRSDHALLCHAARGSDIWVGGQGGTVFHSSDAGATWTQMHPAVKDQQLTSDVTVIKLGKPGEVTLTTNGGESWTTKDNGKNWEKQ